MVMLSRARNIQHWHEKEHPPGSIEACWWCGREKAKCKAKLFRYTDRDQAHEEARQMNEADNYAKPRVAYYCVWCEMYHHTTHPRTHARDALTKQKRKWMFKQELERRRVGGSIHS